MKSRTWMLPFLFMASSNFVYSAPDWSSDAILPGEEVCSWHDGHKVCLKDGNRSNIYEQSPARHQKDVHEGAKHALYYPVTVTPTLVPKSSMEKFFNEETTSPLRKFIYKIAKAVSKYKSMDDVYAWLGLHKYPETVQNESPNLLPFMGSDIEKDPMGVTTRKLHGTETVTFSCAGCHSADLFGVKVLGMTNRFPRANEFFHLGKNIIDKTPSAVFKTLFDPSREDLFIYKQTKDALKYVEVKKPLALGLDTSLAQVGLSLSRRGADENATKIPLRARFPRRNALRHQPADSKPAVWWNLKYKTRWLSDGSIISGNPIHTNFLWNEIGRGVDLELLEAWLLDNQDVIKELTSYVFNAKAPKYNDFFPRKIDIAKARRGEKLFLKTCAGCHGQYEKGWSDSALTQYEDKIKTTKVWYHKRTPVIDVGTDPYRREGMKHFYKDLNRLKISETIGTVVQPQGGYVPPPLVGIWARWPYFHNNSAPTLFDVLTPDYKRPKFYVSVPAENKLLDFDQVKNGYPEPSKVRMPYKMDKEHFFDATQPGLSNQGHTKMMVDENGNERFSRREKLELVEFLKTL